MGVVLSASAVSKRFGAQPLFENLTLAIHDGQRIGLTGPNGAGKSTLVKILAGLEPPDSGTRSVRKQAVIAYVEQDSFFPEGISVREVLEHALREAPLSAQEKTVRIEMEASRAGLNDFDMQAAALSGGWRKRLSIVAGLVREPAVILLDEPTNHLDIDGIIWLQGALKQAECAALFISHDRYFLEQVATHMGEINKTYPDGMYFVEGNYTKFLERRGDFLMAQQRNQESLQARVRREIEWLRRGAKARTTKAKARVDEANRLIDELAEVSDRNAERATAGVNMTASKRQTKRLIVGEGLAKGYGGRTLFESLDVTLTAGMRLALVGGNGCGKSTLLRILCGDIEADSGTVERAEHLKIVTLDQNRRLTDETVTLRRALCDAGDTVTFQGRPIHVIAWAKRFLFQEEQLVQPVAQLSGGERARVLLANLMLQPADVLFLDEPTNDLDIPTLEVLEENLLAFTGAMVLVTHDRYLLDRIANTVLALNGDGTWGTFAEYSQWEQERARPSSKKETVKQTTAAPPVKKKVKLSYMDQREWDGLEVKIHEAEAAVAAADYTQHEALQAEVDRLYHRWAELEGKLKN
ncbi:MAG: ABC-F family ATP-binding cassette domain-containing protein [Acidobacteria bacterium]|nr:ABC-F family ATP-binding cassette domain-containing protein [Acidobacteriota bacterium]